MKSYIENKLLIYPKKNNNISSFLVHLFTVLGNGEELCNDGYLYSNYKNQEIYKFSEPVALTFIYPWTNNEENQPFRKLSGCRDVGFKETVKYFIECIKITPDNLPNIKEWKENINLVEEVLLQFKTIKDQYQNIESGYLQFTEKLKNYKTTTNNNFLFKQWFFDVPKSNCPEFVIVEIQQLWKKHNLGNDNYILKINFNEELFYYFPNIYYWLLYNGVQLNDKVILHWWW